jgi:hypothetical protein
MFTKYLQSEMPSLFSSVLVWTKEQSSGQDEKLGMTWGFHEFIGPLMVPSGVPNERSPDRKLSINFRSPIC